MARTKIPWLRALLTEIHLHTRRVCKYASLMAYLECRNSQLKIDRLITDLEQLDPDRASRFEESYWDRHDQAFLKDQPFNYLMWIDLLENALRLTKQRHHGP